MIRLVTLSIALASIAACSTSGVEAPEPASATPVARSDAPADNAEELQEINAPEVPLAASPGGSDEVICRRETPLGSHMSRRVCRTRAEIEAAQTESQEMMRGFGAVTEDISEGE